MPLLDLDAFRATPLTREPYEHLCLPGFVRAEHREAVARDCPRVDRPGSIPLGVYPHGPAFAALLEELRGPEVRAAFGEKFGIDLAPYPTMVTVRGRCRAADGRVHTDSAGKILTVLLYMNPPWEAPGGRLRVLRSPDLEDCAAEVLPEAGTLLCFRRSDRSWHGHHPFEGERRVLQLNWVKGRAFLWHEQARHRIAAWAKRAVGG